MTIATNVTDLFGYGLPATFTKELVILAKYFGVAFVGQLAAMAVAPKKDRLPTSLLLLWLPVTPVFCSWVCSFFVIVYLDSFI